jgi:hypothetical protein
VHDDGIHFFETASKFDIAALLKDPQTQTSRLSVSGPARRRTTAAASKGTRRTAPVRREIFRKWAMLHLSVGYLLTKQGSRAVHFDEPENAQMRKHKMERTSTISVHQDFSLRAIRCSLFQNRISPFRGSFFIEFDTFSRRLLMSLFQPSERTIQTAGSRSALHRKGALSGARRVVT